MRQILKESHNQNRFRSLMRRKLKLKIVNLSSAVILLLFLDEYTNHALFQNLQNIANMGAKLKFKIVENIC
jgi:hypothetical protein